MTLDPILTRALESGSKEDLEAVSQWWASGLHARRLDPQIARTLVDRGATLTVHAAAGLGFTDHLARMLEADRSSDIFLAAALGDIDLAKRLIDANGCLGSVRPLSNWRWRSAAPPKVAT
jgi:hypothetical protein